MTTSTLVRPAHLDTLDAATRGTLIRPADGQYDTARAVYNAMIDRRPAAILLAEDAADVQAAVRFAGDHDLPLAVRGGSHSVPGFGTCDGGLVLDLGAIRNVRVDPARRTAQVGGGALLGGLDHATQAHGLAVPAGFISTTGVGGLTLGGGIGPYLSRRCGLTCDNLLSAELVTADGRVVTATPDEQEDLFWALKGGGGNFGVVTSFEFGLHPVREVVAGPMFFELGSAAEIMRFFREYIATAPRELGLFFGFHLAPPLPFIPEAHHGKPFPMMVGCWSGAPEHAEAIFRDIRSAGPVVAEHVDRMPYAALQGAFDALVPAGLQNYWKADFVADLTDEAIEAHVEFGPRIPAVNSAMHIYPIDGAVHDVGRTATAFAHRGARFALNIAGLWPDPKDNDANIGWVRDYYDAVHPHSGYEGGYTNFMAADDQGRVRANFGDSFDRLLEIKAKWDPDNLFRLNQNIRSDRK